MRHLLWTALVVLVGLPVAAVDVPFRDGSVVEAVNYSVTGSYIMVEMANGSRVAYDVADIDLDALRQAEAAAAEAAADAAGEVPAEAAGTALGVSRGLTVPEDGEEGSSGGLTITDQHVKHVRGSGINGPEDEDEGEPEDEGGLPDGYEEGGSVVLNNVSVSPIEGGLWEVQGQVVNRSPDTVLDVRANLQASLPGDQPPWTASVPVSGSMSPDEKATFMHTFSSPEGAGEGWSPQVQVNVVWMREETRLEPNYNRNAPHPSALPLDRGGVGGADVRPTPPEV